ncbi:MAG: HD-GYP domain-containing protein, partial [Desulfotignum sp.]
AVMALEHHERYNGTGYPKGLKGDDIHIAGRIAAIADVFDALTSERPYKKAFSLEKAFDIMAEERGKSFDPEILDAFFSIKKEIIEIRNTHSFDHKMKLDFFLTDPLQTAV